MSPKTPPKSRKTLWITVAALVIAGAAGGGWFWYSGTAAAQAKEVGENTAGPARQPAIYFALEPSFVVNLVDPNAVRYLQADVQLMTRDDATAKALELHAPAVRNRLLLLFGQHSSSQLALRSAKERLQDTSRDEVRALLKSEGAADKVDAVYFTSFVTQ